MSEPALSHQPSCTCLQCNPQSVEAPATHHLTKPTLTHDIEEWIMDHSHAAIYASQGRLHARYELLERRVARLETWVIQNEPHFETDDGAIEHLPQEPRGPHD